MLTDEQIFHLLARCEYYLGKILTQTRGNLCSRGWLPAVWELLILDAASQVGRVYYEEPTPSGKTPDLFLEASGSQKVWIEAALLVKNNQQKPTTLNRHPVYKKLEEKADWAKQAGVKEPIVVILGSDRVFELGEFHWQDTPSREQAIHKLFRVSRSLSAVILIPMLLEPEPLLGFARGASPAWVINPDASILLSQPIIDTLNRIDFNRWPLSILTQDSSVRNSLRQKLQKFHGRKLITPSIEAYLLPNDLFNLPAPVWTYYWEFNHLKIAYLGKRYWLLNGDNKIGDFSSPEGAAKVASELFQRLGRILGSNGVQANSDTGVPSDLTKWVLELSVHQH